MEGVPTKDSFVGPVIFQHPSHLRPNPASDNIPDVVEIKRPPNPPVWGTEPSPPPTFPAYRTGNLFGSKNVYGFIPVNPSQRPSDTVDLTKSEDNIIPDSVIFGGSFGAADPYNYVDAGQATENIKALLEGALEDEEDKRRTRGRKKKVETKVEAAVEGLAGKLKNLGVKSDEEGKGKEEVEDEQEDEDVDDGTVEGLKVKLLPHQVDGVEWMRDKEIGVKKKNGILPKGGILADDV